MLGRSGVDLAHFKAPHSVTLVKELPKKMVLVDAETKKILGASLLGIECDEVIHSILDVMYANAPYTVIQRAMHIHPTVSEHDHRFTDIGRG